MVHWPGTPPQNVGKLTNHEDVMTTLMQRLLHVKTAPEDYSQGEDLFAAQRNNNWVATGDNGILVITTPTQTIVLDNNGVIALMISKVMRSKMRNLNYRCCYKC